MSNVASSKNSFTRSSYDRVDWGKPIGKIVNLTNWEPIIAPDAKYSSANYVFRSRLSTTDLHFKVDETIISYEPINVTLRWLMTPQRC
jgi:hypothetical protein